MNVPGRRQQRLSELIKTTISEILMELKDPRLEMVTITRAEVAKDMKTAKIYFSVLGEEERQRTAQRGLETARGKLQAELRNKVRLRYTPVLRFEYDPAIAGSVRIAQLLKEALPDDHDDEEDIESNEEETED
ncbi:MAG: 30S ribosome-binding factor RbfA [Planctomycetota bacterium]|jgi:ribosome-binding factor A|nr:30S ribosome-binding factor RbfA [Planctomycetota bacterium]MDP7250456.1 30S ribosome-binding factor RbfA [Planctomycetota bacterium]